MLNHPTRTFFVILPFVFAGILLAACAWSAIPTAGTLPTSLADAKAGTLRFGTFSTPNASSMAWLMALELLREQGYTVETTIFASSDLTIDTLARGEVDIVGVNVASWAAIPKGANITSLVAHNANPFSIVATNAVAGCSDLNGRSFAVGTAGTTNALLVDRYLKENCGSSAPIIETITDSQARRAALLAGQVDATTLEIADMQQLETQAPGKFHTLVEFSKAFPDINFTVAMTNRAFAAAHPERVRDYVQSIVTVNRSIRANPQLLREAMVRLLNYTPAQAQATAEAYLAANVWDADGGLSAESIKTTLVFLAQQGAVPATLQVQDVADLSYLNAVLDELGRK